MSTTMSSPVTALPQLHIDTSHPSPTTARAVVTGEVDLATAPALRERLLCLLHDHGPDLLDVDLAGVTYLDCTGIGALVAVRNAAVRTGRRVRVSHPQPIVRRVLEVTGLLGVFTAPIDSSAPEPAGCASRPRVGPALVDAAQPTELLAVA